ncbi:general substrate transporter [Cryphonectria parasitica EP155]|uniref:General substrate transporter n=1 Tax=Cryphonectria parasitica (strain ATCC 38755 / EP155) TaxID=660469 RepID=A0A9P5CNW7_CRYP1|nr:general substrate transporter [Cryphonectria parasitica EP155]KAF3764556.1 general substrate transporter [Cryphonectria parasitica EP155]
MPSNSSPIAVVSPKSIWGSIQAHRRTYVLTAVASFGGMLFGWDTGLIGGVLTMKSFQHSFDLDSKSASYANLQGNIVSVLQGGCFFGAAASFWLSDKIGRKWSLILADLVFLAGSIIQTCCAIGTTSLAQLYIGRFIGGFGVGLISAVVPTYIGENANREIRGRCIGCMQLFNVTGIMISYFINYGISKQITDPNNSAQWRIPFALQMLPGLLLLLVSFQNESPRWLVEKNRISQARRALSHVRAVPEDDPALREELDEIVADFEGKEKLSLGMQARAACSNKKMFYQASLGVVLMFWQQWTGTNSINYYSPQIFESVGLSSSSAGLFATGIYGVVKVVFTALALMFGVEQAGRKWSLICGAAGQAFAMFYIGINQAVHPTDKSLSGNNIFAIICVYLFVVFYSFGWGPIPFILASECSPNHVRSLVMAASLMTQWLFNFVIAKLTPIMLADITFGTYLLFGACCALMLVYAVFCVPETKGVPLESVGILFEGNIVAGATRDTCSGARARKLREQHLAALSSRRGVDNGGKLGNEAEHFEDAP